MTAFTLPARADIHALRETLAQRGRVQAQDFLRREDADALYACLERETDWRTVFNHGERHVDLHAMQVTALDPRMPGVLAKAVSDGAAAGFQYVFDNFPIFDAARSGEAMPVALRAVHDLIAGDAFLASMRDLTGDSRIVFADMQATRYRPGHFLTDHNDSVEGKNRLYAYVLNLTRDWRPDWGGVLAFHDENGDIAFGLTPRFNTLNLFAVPQAHAVTMVAPFAPRPRYAITGWLRGTEP